MCEFISWIERPEGIYFFTDRELKTERGKALDERDICGHGAIEAYYGIGGVHGECTDFSSPDNFPPEIVVALKKGQFSMIGDCSGILTDKAVKEILERKKFQAALEKWQAAREKHDAAREKHDAAREKCHAAWEKCHAAWEKCQAAWEKCQAAREKCQAAREKYDAIFRVLTNRAARKPENRKEMWR